jgi:hypothetical protein
MAGVIPSAAVLATILAWTTAVAAFDTDCALLGIALVAVWLARQTAKMLRRGRIAATR